MALQLNSVLITDEVDPKCVAILKQNGVQVTKNTALAKDKPALLNEIPKYDGLIVRSGTTVTADIIEASNLKIIGRAGTGTDNIDSNAATKKGVIVMNTPGGNTISAAELTCTMICSMSRHVAQACQSMKEGRWDRKKYMGAELQGKTLAVIGLGRIGREVAYRMRSFGMTTIGYDPLVSAEESEKFDVKSYPIEELWPLADYITVHVPLIPPTKNLINANVFAKCKRGVRVINCARGGIIDEAALLVALNNGECGGAGLDVYCEEPPKDLSLVQHPLVLATPHLGASTVEAQSRVAEEIAQQFIDVRDGKSLFGAINAPAMVNALSPASQPWVALGRALGSALAALAQAPAPITVQAAGSPDMKTALSFLKTAVCVGALKNKQNNGLNLVNAPLVAKENGLEVETKYIEAAVDEVCISSGNVKLAGTVQGMQPVLTLVNGFNMPGAALRADSVCMLYSAQDNAQVLSAVVAAVATSGGCVTSFSRSNPVNGEVLGMLELSSAPADIGAAKLHVTNAVTFIV